MTDKLLLALLDIEGIAAIGTDLISRLIPREEIARGILLAGIEEAAAYIETYTHLFMTTENEK